MHPWKTLAKVRAQPICFLVTPFCFIAAPCFVARWLRGNSYSHNNGSAKASLRFGAHGSGAKPVFLASEALDLPSDWVSEGATSGVRLEAFRATSATFCL